MLCLRFINLIEDYPRCFRRIILLNNYYTSLTNSQPKVKKKKTKMRLPTKKLIIIVAIVIFPAFVLNIFGMHFGIKRRMSNSEISKAMPERRCLKEFKNVQVKKKLAKALFLGDVDSFMFLLQKYLPDCQKQLSEFNPHGYGLIEPNLTVSSTSSTYTNSTHLTQNFSTEYTNLTRKPLCPPQSPLLQGHVDIDLSEHEEIRKKDGRYINWPLSLEEIAVTYQNLQLGGFYPGPESCRCRGYNAVIVPFRNRDVHLRYFLYYMHQLLQRQQLCYIIIVVEQNDEKIFNKGQLMNTAFQYARELMSFDCYIFHDVDVIAEDDRILYTCREDKIMHYAPYIDKYDYKFISVITVGAAVGFTEDQFLAVNGYSNEYGGWGGEDDDMAERIKIKNIPVWRSERNHTKFRMIKHGSDPGNTANEHRYQRLKLVKDRQRFDGLNHLDTLLEENTQYRTHTRLKVKTYQTGLQKDYERNDKSKAQGLNKLNVGIPVEKRRER